MSEQFWLQLGLGGACLGVLYSVLMVVLRPILRVLLSLDRRVARIEAKLDIPDDEPPELDAIEAREVAKPDRRREARRRADKLELVLADHRRDS